MSSWVKTRWFWIVFMLVLDISTAIHLIFLNITPREWDENVYLNIVTSVLRLGYPSLNFNQGNLQFFPYHPPFHFYAMAIWFAITGDISVYNGRIFSTIIAVTTVVVAMLLVRICFNNKKAALITGFILATDGWFSYTSLLIKFDTAATLIGMLGFLLYIQAWKLRSIRRGIAAGIILGFAASYKHVGIVAAFAVALHFVLLMVTSVIHKEVELPKIKLHLLVLFCTGVVVLTYMAGMALTVREPYIDATTVQINRALGVQVSRGLNYGLGEAVQALVQTYWAFFGSIFLLVISNIIAIRKTWKHFRAQELEISPLTSWVLASTIMLAGVRLRNPHYLVYAIVPSAMLVGLQLAKWMNGLTLQQLGILVKMRIQQITTKEKIAVGILAFLFTASMFAGVIRSGIFSGNDVLARIDQKLDEIPPDTVIFSEETVCAMASQECYAFDTIKNAERIKALKPDLVIVYLTTTQSPPDLIWELIINDAEEIKDWTVNDWKAMGQFYLTSFNDQLSLTLEE